MTRTEALGKLYKKITGEDMPIGANTTTEALQKVYEALTEDTKHHINVTEIIDDLAANWSGGGGGGSSDFSTATMTVINTVERSDVGLSGVFIDPNDNLIPFYECGYGTRTVIVVLYKGNAIGSVGAEEVTSSTGDITLEEDLGFTISGDCTVTAKGYLRE